MKFFHIFKTKVHPEGSKSFKKRWMGYLENLVKCFLMLLFPLPVPAVVTVFWYYVMYRNGIHFKPELEGTMTAAWIPGFFVVWGIMVAYNFGSVGSQFQEMYIAVIEHNLETFMKYRDQKIPMPMHAGMFALSGAMVLAFMAIKYPDPISGAIIVSSATYIFTLFFVVLVELDNPTSGLFYLKNIPGEWLELSVEAWRRCFYKKKREEALEQIRLVTVTIQQEVVA